MSNTNNPRVTGRLRPEQVSFTGFDAADIAKWRELVASGTATAEKLKAVLSRVLDAFDTMEVRVEGGPVTANPAEAPAPKVSAQHASEMLTVYSKDHKRPQTRR